MLSQINSQDLKALQVFMAVTDCQGVSAAQTILNMAQSAISLHLKYIEDKFGFVLCHRGRSGFALTEEGKRVYQACQHLSNSFNKFSDEILTIQADNQVLSGSINIALVDKLPDHFKTALSNCIKLIYETNQNISLNIEIQSPQEIESKILNNQIDLGIGYFSKQIKEIVYKKISTERQNVYYSYQHPLAKVKEIDVDKIATDYPWVKRGYVISDGLVPLAPSVITATSKHMETTLLFILAGTHLGYLPENYADFYVQSKLLYPIDHEQVSYVVPLYLISKNSYSPLIRLFVLQLIKALKNLEKNG